MAKLTLFSVSNKYNGRWFTDSYFTAESAQDAHDANVNKGLETRPIVQSEYHSSNVAIGYIDPYTITSPKGLERVGEYSDCRGSNRRTLYINPGDEDARKEALEFIRQSVKHFNDYYSQPWV